MTNVETIAILAGGLATRMRPLTETVPKSMLEVAGEPFIAHQLRLLAREGLKRAVLCLGYLGEKVAGFVGDGSRFGLSVETSYDGAHLLGTGGALRKALPKLGDVFFVLYGDSYLDIAYQPVSNAFFKAGRKGLMTLLRNEDRWDKSNAIFSGDRILRYSKKDRHPDMRYIDYGLSVLHSSALTDYTGNEASDLADIFSRLAGEGDLTGFEVGTRFYEIGSMTGLAEIEAYLRQSRA